METLYVKYKSAVDGFERDFPHTAEITRHIYTAVAMAQAVFYNPASVRNWLHGKSGPTKRAERFAKMWLEQHRKPQAPVSDDVPEKPPTKPAATGDVLMVICPDGMKDRALKLLSVIGCEAVEI